MATKHNHFGRTSVLIAVAAVMLAACLLVLAAAEKPAQAAFAGANGLIAFVSDRDSTTDAAGNLQINDEIYVMDADGSRPIRLTNNPAIDQFPAVSPDGTKIAFLSNRNGSYEVWVMDSKDENDDGNGDNLRLLPDSATKFWSPYGSISWSPNGEKIAFTSYRDSTATQDVWVTNVDGSGTPTRLTTSPRFDGAPVFSPDGNKIFFVSNRLAPDGTSDFELWVMNAAAPESATNLPIPLTNNPATDARPEVSPKGDRIAFESNRDGNFEIYAMNADGSQQTKLTDNTTSGDVYPAWSPDGTRIAFWSGSPSTAVNPFTHADILVMNASGSGTPANLTNNTFGDAQPDWGPDTTMPEITLTTPAEGAAYTLHQSVMANYECADEGGSGLASCVGDVPSGDPIDTATVGSKTFTVTAKDNGGNTSSVTHTYSVTYDFHGFLSPVDNPPTLNLAKAGSAIPVNFSLSGDQGLDIFADGYPTSQKIECDSGAPSDPVEETLSANQSGLTYDASSDQYTYAWKTNKAWAGSCRQLVVVLKDGTEHLANFEFK